METVTPNGSEKSEQAQVEWEKVNLKRMRRTAVFFGILTTFFIISLVYAYVQNNIAGETRRGAELQSKLIKEMEIKLQQCKDEALKQEERAKLQMMIANEALRKAGKR